VDDAATAGLMAQFYSGLLAERLPAATALREAQAWMRTQPQWQSPYYWAAFELQGEWK
jgi:CHAT domain-containing protein